MGKKCSALGCTSGYDSEKGRSVDQRITMHSYPLKDKELCEKWIRANPRKDFQPTTNSGLCSLHFRESDFVEYSQVKDSSQQKQTGKRLLCRRYLKKDAVPSVIQMLQHTSQLLLVNNAQLQRQLQQADWKKKEGSLPLWKPHLLQKMTSLYAAWLRFVIKY